MYNASRTAIVWRLPEQIPLRRLRPFITSFPVVEGLVIKGGCDVNVLNAMSLHGGLPASWPDDKITAKYTVECMIEHWKQFGLPDYVQFDNDARFVGAQANPDVLGRVLRACLSLGVTPVLAPPRETGFQAAIEAYNGQWQAKVWARFQHADLNGVIERSGRYVAAARQRSAPRIEAAPSRRPFPKGWRLDLQARPRGTIIFLRRTDDEGSVSLLGHRYDVNANWVHRLVRAEVNLTKSRVRFFALRRREPTAQPLLKEAKYRLPKRAFME